MTQIVEKAILWLIAASTAAFVFSLVCVTTILVMGSYEAPVAGVMDGE
jgi:hypothetical protein